MYDAEFIHFQPEGKGGKSEEIDKLENHDPNNHKTHPAIVSIGFRVRRFAHRNGA